VELAQGEQPASGAAMSAAHPIEPLFGAVTIQCTWVDRQTLGAERWDTAGRPMSFDALNVILDGSAWIVLDGAEYRLGPGDAVFMTQGTFYSRGRLAPEAPLEVAWLQFQAFTHERVRLFSLAPPPQGLTGKTVAEMRRLLEEALTAWRGERPGRALLVDGLALQMLALAYQAPEADLLRPLPLRPHAPAALATANSQQALIREALGYLTAHLGEPVTLDDLAGQASMHPSAFSRLFHRLVGVPPMRFLESLRLAEAERLLLNTELRVNEIASAVGYADPYHFSRVFRRRQGVSPSAFRAKVNSVHPSRQ
jgi:AraC-like DNA-binding protein